MFKYYLGKIALIKKDGSITKAGDYYLVDESDATTKEIRFAGLPDGDYTGLEFLIGVDSTDNCSGAQSGALDPANAMFWAWNTGYIFLKLEGNAPASKSSGHLLEYHIGGYRAPNNCIRRVRMNFKKPLGIRNGKIARLELTADVEKILSAKNNIDFSALSSVTDFHHATMVADNFEELFTTGQ